MFETLHLLIITGSIPGIKRDISPGYYGEQAYGS